MSSDHNYWARDEAYAVIGWKLSRKLRAEAPAWALRFGDSEISVWLERKHLPLLREWLEAQEEENEFAMEWFEKKFPKSAKKSRIRLDKDRKLL